MFDRASHAYGENLVLFFAERLESPAGEVADPERAEKNLAAGTPAGRRSAETAEKLAEHKSAK